MEINRFKYNARLLRLLILLTYSYFKQQIPVCEQIISDIILFTLYGEGCFSVNVVYVIDVIFY